MKQYSLLMNYVQGACTMQYTTPYIIAKDFDAAISIAEQLITAQYAGVIFVNCNSICSCTSVESY